MEYYIISASNKDNIIKYISNISPLLWTNDRTKAKTFRSKGELIMDLTWHIDSLEKMEKELGLKIEIQQL
jgi:hypothetical protein